MYTVCEVNFSVVGGPLDESSASADEDCVIITVILIFIHLAVGALKFTGK